MSVTKKGLFIAMLGINNLGKSTQCKLLAKKINDSRHPAEHIKYAIKDIMPSGEMVDEYLRFGNKHQLSAREFQIIQALNRTQYQPLLTKKLSRGITVIAEDYVGTSIAWGMGAGVDKDFLTQLNCHLLTPDICILLDGERFLNAIEAGHSHETNSTLTDNVRDLHKQLALEYNWPIINANQSIEKVADDIWRLVQKILD